MRTKDPKQTVISSITDANLQVKREEGETLAIPESILFLKEKQYRYAYAFVVLYTSTSNQQWYDMSFVVQNTDGSFTLQGAILGKAEDSFHIDRDELGLAPEQPYLLISSGKGRQKIVQEVSTGTRGERIEENGVVRQTLTIGSSRIVDDTVEDMSGYRFLVGHLAEGSQHVARVRMIDSAGHVEDDEVQDNTVLFLGEYSFPITFEFYSPSHTLIGTQLRDI